MDQVRESTVVAPYASIEQVTGSNRGNAAPALLEAKLLWRGDAVHVSHVRKRRELRIRDLGFDVPSSPDLVVAREDDEGRLVLCLPNGEAVPEDCRMALRMGRVSLRLTLVPDDVDAPPAALPDRRVAFGMIAAAALHLVVLGLVAHGRAPAGAQEAAARETMQRMVASAEERALAELAAAKERTENDAPRAPILPAAPPAPTPASEQGVAGNPARTARARGRITRGDDAQATRPERAEVASFGLLSLLAGDQGGNGAGSSAFAAETGPSAMGSIFGRTIADGEGAGGLGLSGPGEGGGGLGAGVALSAIAMPKQARAEQSWGCCGGYLPPRGEHRTRAPTMISGVVQTKGRIPPESIQRVIRQSFGRLRGCYEAGLQRSPDLEGRIVVKLVIDRSGLVPMVSTAERSLEDASVASCVGTAFEAMTFPQPEGGIVTVVYPVVFTRTSP